jgi:hypothetical protein
MSRAGRTPHRRVLLGGADGLRRCAVSVGWRFGINPNGAAVFPRWMGFVR